MEFLFLYHCWRPQQTATSRRAGFIHWIQIHPLSKVPTLLHLVPTTTWSSESHWVEKILSQSPKSNFFSLSRLGNLRASSNWNSSPIGGWSQIDCGLSWSKRSIVHFIPRKQSSGNFSVLALSCSYCTVDSPTPQTSPCTSCSCGPRLFHGNRKCSIFHVISNLARAAYFTVHKRRLWARWEKSHGE